MAQYKQAIRKKQHPWKTFSPRRMAQPDFATKKPPTPCEPAPKSTAEQRAIILAALREAGDLGVMLQHLCKAADASIPEAVAHCVELDRDGLIVDLFFESATGVAWCLLCSEPDGAAAPTARGNEVRR